MYNHIFFQCTKLPAKCYRIQVFARRLLYILLERDFYRVTHFVLWVCAVTFGRPPTFVLR